MRAGIVERIGVEQQEADPDGGNDVEHARTAKENAAEREKGEGCGGTNHGRLPSGDQAIQSGGADRQGNR